MSRPTARTRAARSAHTSPQVSRKPSFGDRTEQKSRSNFGSSFSSSFGDASFGIDEPEMATGGVMPMERAIALQAHFMQASGLGAAIQRQSQEDEEINPKLDSPLQRQTVSGTTEEEDESLDIQAKSEEDEPLHRKINVAQLQRQQDEEEKMQLQRQPEEEEKLDRKINVAQLQRQQDEEELNLQRQPEEDEKLDRRINVAALQRQQDEEELKRFTDESKEDELQPRLMIQPKLTIGQPGDKYEQEADRTAAQVMAMPDVGAGGAGEQGSRGAGEAPASLQNPKSKINPPFVSLQRTSNPSKIQNLKSKIQLFPPTSKTNSPNTKAAVNRYRTRRDRLWNPALGPTLVMYGCMKPLI
ncbi:MAG: hypothetical protein AAGD25_02805 [Cyanobacteria bacterium P01_F01_bin.150]